MEHAAAAHSRILKFRFSPGEPKYMEGEEELYDDASKKVTTPAGADVVKSFRPSPSSPNNEPTDLGTHG